MDDCDEKAVRRGIKVIIFSFYEVEISGCDVIVYSHNNSFEDNYKPGRLIVVVDNTIVIIADNNKDRNIWYAIVTNNKLMVKMSSEHIHNDIRQTHY